MPREKARAERTRTEHTEEEKTTTKDTKKNHLVALSFVLFVSFLVDSLSCLNLCNLRILWFLVLLFLIGPRPTTQDTRRLS